MSTPHPLPRPAAGDAAAYYFGYIDLVAPGDVFAALTSGLAATQSAFAPFVGKGESLRYAPGKWTVRELFAHILDTERVFAYRALHIARGGSGELPSMDQDVWSAHAGAEARELGELLAEFDLVRRGHLSMMRPLTTEDWERTGVASGYPVRARALPFILAGHEIHHRRVLGERYLPLLPNP